MRTPLIALIPLLALVTPAAAQVEWALSAWSAGLGLVAPGDDIDTTYWLDGGVDVAQVNRNLTLNGRIMWWGSSHGAGSVLDASDLAFLPGAIYWFPSRGMFTPFARGGLGIHRFKWETFQGLSSRPTTETNTDLGVFLGGGTTFPVNERFEILGTVEVHFMDTNFFVIGAEAHVPLGE